MTTLQMISLDYAIAVYPLLLILLTYAFVRIHDRFTIFQLVLKPVAWLMLKGNYNFGIKRTLIKAFGTFILLSYVNTSVDILICLPKFTMPQGQLLEFMHTIMDHWNILQWA